MVILFVNHLELQTTLKEEVEKMRMELNSLGRDKNYEIKNLKQELESKIRELEYENGRLTKELDSRWNSFNIRSEQSTC